MWLMSIFNITSTNHLTRDGIKLATDIYRPANDDGTPLAGNFPIVLLRTPYDRKNVRYRAAGRYWAANGYVFAIQDCRGRFDSEGEFILLANEGPDGYDAIQWLAGQPYSNGRVGTYGTSYSAWVQNAAALERPEALSAMWVTQGASNGATSSLRHNGVMELRWLTWAVTHGAVSPEALRDPELQSELYQNGVDMYDWLKKLPWGTGPDETPLSGLPTYDQWAKDLYVHGDYDLDADGYWAQKGLNFEPYYDSSLDVPTMYCGGWYDSYTRATIENFLALSQKKQNQYLLMGPWTHGDGNIDSQIAGSVDLGDFAKPVVGLGNSYLEEVKNWFDCWLPNESNKAINDLARIRYFVMGSGTGQKTSKGRILHGGSWRTSDIWPPVDTITQNFYLHSDQLLNNLRPDVEESWSELRYDPSNPLPTVSANTSSLNEIMIPPLRTPVATPITLMRVQVIQGGSDQVTTPEVLGATEPYGPLENREDVLMFESVSLDKDIEITGPIEARLFMESDAPDTDLFVMIQDEYPKSTDWPDGYKLNISDGIFRVRYREGLATPKLLDDSGPVEVQFSLYPTSNLVKQGHKIRVLVSSSSFPRFDPNPNTGEEIGRHTRTQIANNIIHHSANYPSHVAISVIE